MFKVLVISLLFMSVGTAYGQKNNSVKNTGVQTEQKKIAKSATRINYNIGAGLFGGFANINTGSTGIDTLHVLSGYNNYEHNALLKLGMGITLGINDAGVLNPLFSVGLGIGYIWLVEKVRSLDRIGIGVALDIDVLVGAESVGVAAGPALYVVLNKTYLSVGIQYHSPSESAQGRFSVGVFI